MVAVVKAQRHRTIAEILRNATVTSQAELVALLKRKGERVTQATLSRDLEELGAFKARLPDGRVAYRLPEDPPQNGDHMRRILAEFVIGVDSSGPMVVLRTPPGCAQPVARALDNSGDKDVIGTVAGDDTVLVLCREGVSGRAVARRISSTMFGSTSKGA
jgi:transcriptional regulator of arginine metabolism